MDALQYLIASGMNWAMQVQSLQQENAELRKQIKTLSNGDSNVETESDDARTSVSA